MTEKQKKFADEYLIDLNATRAYKAAYKSVKKDSSAMAGASRMLRNAKVAEYIDQKITERSKRTEVKQDDVVRELAKIGFTESLLIGEIEIKSGDKLKALELLGKHLGMFTEKQEIKARISYEEYLSKLDDDYSY